MKNLKITFLEIFVLPDIHVDVNKFPKIIFENKGPGGSPALHGQDLKTRNLGFVFLLVLGRFLANSKRKL